MSKKILIVEDSISVREVVAGALSAAGYAVIEAVDGLEGKELVEKNAELAMILCDVNMPRMNGIEMLMQIKAGGARAGLPVVMLTTEDDPALIQRAKEAGARGWIVKPFKNESVVATVRKVAGPP
jgi:two-component system chemotaxis response regulator CheY